jgi:WD40 repeat protein
VAHNPSTGVAAVAFSPDGECLASAGSSGPVKLLDLTANHRPADLTEAGATNVLFSPLGLLATAGHDRAVRLWSRDGHAVSEPLRHESISSDAIWDWAFDPSGSLLATAVLTGTSKVWNVETSQPAFALTQAKYTNSVAFSCDGQLLATGGHQQAVWIWDAGGDGGEVTNLPQPKSVTELAFSPTDPTCLAVATNDGLVRLIDATTAYELASTRHDGEITAIAFSPEGRLFASAGRDAIIAVVDIESGGERRIGEDGAVKAVSFSADGHLLAVACGEHASVYGLPTLDLLTSLEPGGAVKSLAFSPRDRLLAAGDSQGAALVWDLSGWPPLTAR